MSSLNDYVYRCMKNGHYWTFWELQDVIKQNTGKFYGEPTISASIRALRWEQNRTKYGLPTEGEVVERKRCQGRKGYQYRLVLS